MYWPDLFMLPLLTSFFLTMGIIRWLGSKLIDVPVERSSHSLPTPRGGGIAIVLTTLLTYLWASDVSYPSFIIFIALPLLMSALGTLDDFFNLNVRPRLIAQLALCLLGAYFCLKDLNLPLPGLICIGGVATLALMWSTNLYNFMDGINGIAAVQAISICIAMGVILFYLQSDTGNIYILAIIGAACLGFLYWNFPSAKIFMGDTGSLFLGFIFGLIALNTSIKSIEIASAWMIVMAVFIVDATYTLIIRLLSGQKFYLPHRSHSYQKLALKFNSHTKTTLTILTINTIWLFPLALLTALGYAHPIISIILAYSPLIIIAMKLKAGKK